jgi:hypothetical protein
MKSTCAPILIIALTVLGSTARASGVEVCKLAGTVTAQPVASGTAIYFHLQVTAAEPITCRGFSSQSPSACAAYKGKNVSVGLATVDARSVNPSSAAAAISY